MCVSFRIMPKELSELIFPVDVNLMPLIVELPTYIMY